MAKTSIQPITEQWAAYAFLKSNPEMYTPVMDNIRYAALFRFTRIHQNLKKAPKRNSSRKKDIRDEQFIVFRFLAKPNNKQEQFLRQSAGNCRFLWNLMLADLKKTGTFSRPAAYKKEYDFLKAGDSTSLTNVQLNFESAVSDWRNGKKGFPHFKKKYISKDSFRCTVVYNQSEKGNMTLTDSGIILSKMKTEIKLRLHRKIPEDMILKNCTCTLEPNGKWMFSLQFSIVQSQDLLSIFDKKEIRHIGLDMSLPKLYIDSNGESADFCKPYRNLEKKIAKEQRKLSRMQKFSSNYMKQKQHLANLYAKAKHQRSDMLHKLSCKLTDAYDLITIEDLNMAAMKQALSFGKSVSDNGWGMFVNLLEYKAARKGVLLLFVDKWFPSSKTCHRCGYIHKELQLSDRQYLCPACGHVMDRDVQAAKNIDEEGLRIFYELKKAG